MATHSIGTNSRDYATVTLWLAACPVDITAGGTNENWIGEAYNDSVFNEFVVASGITTDSTHVVKLTTATGQAFWDQANFRNLALNYFGTSGGVAMEKTYAYTYLFLIQINDFILDKWQIKTTPAAGGAYAMASSGARVIAQNCIFKTSGAAGGYISGLNKLINSLCIVDTGSLLNSMEAYQQYCTFINLAGSGTLGVGDYFTSTVQNCAWFGFSTGFSMGIHGSMAGDHNASDLSIPFGTNNQASLTFSSQVVSTTNDFRAKSGGALENNASPISGITKDISNTARSASTPTIGAWELASSGAAFIARKGLTIFQAVNRASTY